MYLYTYGAKSLLQLTSIHCVYSAFYVLTLGGDCVLSFTASTETKNSFVKILQKLLSKNVVKS